MTHEQNSEHTWTILSNVVLQTSNQKTRQEKTGSVFIGLLLVPVCYQDNTAEQTSTI